MSKRVRKPVSFKPSELQKLRLQLAQRECDLNGLMRLHSAETLRQFRLWEAQHPSLSEHLRAEADRLDSEMEAELVDLEREAERLQQEFFQAGAAIKKENSWPEKVRWNTTTLEFYPAQSRRTDESEVVQ